MLIFQGENVVFAGGGDSDPRRWVMESSSKTRQTSEFRKRKTEACRRRVSEIVQVEGYDSERSDFILVPLLEKESK
jgi:hypothetical protein